uniref:50S ribosomal protein L16 n=1 Tax=Nephromyces sp. ex Molgula occidentalis TaxID=2544991 RepID=A0A5C1H7C8_9APIC|nr:50S ribosomal protein L16 [Nephromyces sp. ex Molgula occidentalis]
MISKTKYFHLKKIKGKRYLNPNLYFGNSGMQAMSNSIISTIHINLIKKIFNNKLKKICKIYFRVNWNQIKTKKPASSRMGSGKGNLDLYVCNIQKGDVLFELNKLPNDIIINFYKTLSYKLPFKTRIIYKHNNNI